MRDGVRICGHECCWGGEYVCESELVCVIVSVSACVWEMVLVGVWVCLFVSLCASVQIGNRVKLTRRGIILIKVQPQVELHFHWMAALQRRQLLLPMCIQQRLCWPAEKLVDGRINDPWFSLFIASEDVSSPWWWCLRRCPWTHSFLSSALDAEPMQTMDLAFTSLLTSQFNYDTYVVLK